MVKSIKRKATKSKSYSSIIKGKTTTKSYSSKEKPDKNKTKSNKRIRGYKKRKSPISSKKDSKTRKEQMDISNLEIDKRKKKDKKIKLTKPR